MLYQKCKVLMVSERDFYKELETSEDIKLSNLKNDIEMKADAAEIVMYKGNDLTYVMKNKFGSVGAVIPEE